MTTKTIKKDITGGIWRKFIAGWNEGNEKLLKGYIKNGRSEVANELVKLNKARKTKWSILYQY